MAHHYRLYFVRHLKSAANEKRQYCGWTDSELAETDQQAIDLPAGKVFGSDLKRARQTAELYFPGVEYAGDRRWRECHFGEFEEKTYEQLKHNEAYRNWLDDPWQQAPIGGETLHQVKKRVLEALYELQNGAVVVTHGGVIRILLDTFSAGPHDFWQWKVDNGSVWQFEWADEQQWKEGKRCTSLSEVPITAKNNM